MQNNPLPPRPEMKLGREGGGESIPFPIYLPSLLLPAVAENSLGAAAKYSFCSRRKEARSPSPSTSIPKMAIPAAPHFRFLAGWLAGCSPFRRARESPGSLLDRLGAEVGISLVERWVDWDWREGRLVGVEVFWVEGVGRGGGGGLERERGWERGMGDGVGVGGEGEGEGGWGGWGGGTGGKGGGMMKWEGKRNGERRR